MNPRELPEEPGLGKPLPRKEEKPQAKVDEWKPYGEKEKGLEQNTRTGELRTNRPPPSRMDMGDVLMRLRDTKKGRECALQATQQESPNTFSPKEPTLEAAKSRPSGKELMAQSSRAAGVSSALDAGKYGEGRLSMQEQVERTAAKIYQEAFGSAPTAPVESTGAEYYRALPAGSPKTNWPGTMTGQMGRESGNSRDCLNWVVQEFWADEAHKKGSK